MTSRTPDPRFALALAAVGLSTSALALAACASAASPASPSTALDPATGEDVPAHHGGDKSKAAG
ncbi:MULTISPECIES: hypothetical protein [unclassified Microbacterium]|uniref:hypothetical protein n=1 Tax=unclassified Microbacterium TaxID=2609290 RepID=UPI000B02ACF1|nr:MULTISPECIES: hypothetical protein [unclassified Microbacterium]MEA1263853.1 hypothetical protein [Microbacterium sp. STF-2]